jgi:hypothetical protein
MPHNGSHSPYVGQGTKSARDRRIFPVVVVPAVCEMFLDKTINEKVEREKAGPYRGVLEFCSIFSHVCLPIRREMVEKFRIL